MLGVVHEGLSRGCVYEQLEQFFGPSSFSTSTIREHFGCWLLVRGGAPGFRQCLLCL